MCANGAQVTTSQLAAALVDLAPSAVLHGTTEASTNNLTVDGQRLVLSHHLNPVLTEELASGPCPFYLINQQELEGAKASPTHFSIQIGKAHV